MLAGRRLFLGDTDFATVKLVQQAVIPRSRKVNPKVPPELERIVNKALARDPAQRYQSARELGRRRSTSSSTVTARRSAASTSRRWCSRAMREQAARAPDAALDHRQADRRGAVRVHLAAGGQRDVGPSGEPGSPDAGCRASQPREVQPGHDWAREIAIQDSDSARADSRAAAAHGRGGQPRRARRRTRRRRSRPSCSDDARRATEPARSPSSLRPAPIAPPTGDSVGMPPVTASEEGLERRGGLRGGARAARGDGGRVLHRAAARRVAPPH